MAYIVVDIVFEDWRQKGKTESIYNEELGFELSKGDLHSGTTWDTTIGFPEDIIEEIELAYIRYGAYPVFRVIPKL